MEAVKLKGGLKAAMKVSSLGNLYLQVCYLNLRLILQDFFLTVKHERAPAILY